MLERLKELVEEAGGQTKVSALTGAEPRTISRWLKGENSPKFEHLSVVAKATGISLEWLANGVGPKFTAGKPLFTPKMMPMHDFKTVPRYNAAASAGNGSFIEYAEKLDEIPFTEDFMLKRFGRTKTDGLIIVDAAGDSMEPTIGDGDLIMIDTDKKQLTAAIYAFTFEDSFYVKRLNNLPDAIKATSDNKEYDPFVIERDQMNRVDILGRVVWVGHTP